MTAALIIAGALAAAGILLYVHHRLTTPAGGEERRGGGEREGSRDAASRVRDGDESPAGNDRSKPAGEEECCGRHAVCGRDSLLAAVSRDIVYYDDEELDAYAGRDPRSYTPEETEEFRNVLLTLLPGDVAGWGRSVQLRGIELPVAVRDELIMMVSEARQGRGQQAHR